MGCDRLLQYCRHHNKLYCYGAGRYGREVCVFLDENSINLDGFIVTTGSKNHVLDVAVYEFENIVIGENDGIIVAVGNRYLEQITSSLKSRGIEDFFLISDELLEQIEEYTKYDKVYPNNKLVNALLYHRIANTEDDFWNISVSQKHFEEQIKWLSENYPIIKSTDDFTKITKPSFVITFDDGYADNYDIAFPILEKYGVPATFFISTGMLDGYTFWWDELYRLSCSHDESFIRQMHSELRKLSHNQRREELMKLDNNSKIDTSDVLCKGMTSEQLVRMAESDDITIGAHTVTHSSLANLTKDEQINEIKGSVSYLEKLLNRRVTSFSYPLGDYDEATIEILRSIGISKAFTVAGGLVGKGDELRIPRNIVLDQDIDSFKNFIKRCFCVYSEVRD